jgi:hypothetical protein
MNKKAVVGLEDKLGDLEIARPTLHDVSRIFTSQVQRFAQAADGKVIPRFFFLDQYTSKFAQDRPLAIKNC